MELAYFYSHEADQFSFIRIPKMMVTEDLYSELSLQAKVLYGMLIDRVGTARKNDWLDEENRVYIIYPISEIQEDMKVSKKKAIDSLAELVKIGLVEKKQRGLGLPSILYVKSFVTNAGVVE